MATPNPMRNLMIVGLLLAAASCAAAPKRPPLPEIFYPGPPAEPRLQLLARFSGTEDVEESSAFKQFVVGDEPRLSLERVQGVAWSDGRLYVCDPTLGHVFIFDLAKRELRPLAPSQRGLFRKPIEIAVAPDKWKYVTDTAHRKVLVFDARDRYVKAYGDPKRWRPVGLAVTADRIYVTDAANHALVVLDRATGEEVRRIGKLGGGEAEFYYPIGVAVGPAGDLYVVDSFNFRIQRLKPDGTFVRSFGKVGQRPGSFARPRGVTVDRDGRVYAIDAAFQNCQVFSPEGELLIYFGGSGTEPGAMNLPALVKISYEAADAFRDKVAEGFDIEYVLFITSQAPPNLVNVYGFLRKK